MSSGEVAHNGATRLIDTMLTLGVTKVFGYPVGAALPIYDARYARRALRHILVRHEQAAVRLCEEELPGWAGVAQTVPRWPLPLKPGWTRWPNCASTPPPTTHQRPVDCFEGERDQLERLKPNGYDLGTIEKVRATSTCKVPLESNHYSVPPHLAGQADERARACPQDPRPGRAAWPPGGGAAFRHGLALQACSAEYIANILVARRPIGQEPTALQLPRSADLVELAWPEPDRSIFDRQRGTDQAHSK